MKYLVTGDWHLSGKKPVSRRDEDWVKTQRKAVKFVFQTAKENGATIIHTGDVFDSHSVNREVEIMLIQLLWRLERAIIALPGNHDFRNKYHISSTSYSLISACFWCSSRVSFAHNIAFKEFPCMKWSNKLLIHTLIGNQGLPGMRRPQEIFNMFPNYKCIFSGDNHQSFVAISKDEKQILINPGCLIRRTKAEADYICSLYLFDDSKPLRGSYKLIQVPEFGEFIPTEEIEAQKERVEEFKKLTSTIEQRLTKGLTYGIMSYKEEIVKGMLADPEIRPMVEKILEESRIER